MKMVNANVYYRLKTFYPAGFDLLRKYKTEPGEVSIAKGIPVTPENMFILGEIGKIIKIRKRYRGPRADSIGRMMRSGYRRTAYSARLTCLKEDATTVSVYLR
jgi:hypothetical protein